MAYAPHCASLQTPVGTIVVEGDVHAVRAVRIEDSPATSASQAAPADSPVGAAIAQLAGYFAGERQHFDLPLEPLSSPRGMALRQGMAAIPYGTTLTYGALAQALGSAPRAIGQACRRNPFPIIIPCHRVTSSAGPEHYSAGNGAATKAWLNAFELRNLPAGERTRLL